MKTEFHYIAGRDQEECEDALLMMTEAGWRVVNSGVGIATNVISASFVGETESEPHYWAVLERGAYPDVLALNRWLFETRTLPMFIRASHIARVEINVISAIPTLIVTTVTGFSFNVVNDAAAAPLRALFGIPDPDPIPGVPDAAAGDIGISDWLEETRYSVEDGDTLPIETVQGEE